ncbi:MAG: hypothetical protein HY868_14155 [Chloroflexi bacterium]|nr:hypothetical protein [Chloroflexota bacterium]
MKRALVFFVMLMVALVSAMPTHAQDAITITSNKFTSNFRTNLLFQVDAQSSAEITTMAITVQLDGIASSSRFVPEFTPGARVNATYTWNLATRYIPPGVTGQYWWTIEDKAGNKKQSDKFNFRVEDTTKTWKKMSNEKFALYWYSGGDTFGKQLFDRAIAGLNATEKGINANVSRQLQIFVYGNRADFFAAMEPGTRDWTGGRAFSDYGITLINIGSNDLEFGLRAVPHELTHLVIQLKLGDLGTSALPQWMNEGLAVYYETVPPSLEDYLDRALKRAIQNDTLLPMRTLVGSFATANEAAYLSYAQSYSMIEFITRHYGKDKLMRLLDAFKNARHYDDVMREVLSVDTDGLEAEWRKDIGAKPRVVATRSNATATPFPTFSLSTDPNPPPTVARATATPQSVAAAATSAPAPTAAPKSAPSNNPLTSVCGGAFGFILLGLVGATWAWKRLHKTRETWQ